LHERTAAHLFLNGSYLPLEQASVSPFDRAFLFGDAVYEVVRFTARAPSGCAITSTA